MDKCRNPPFAKPPFRLSRFKAIVRLLQKLFMFPEFVFLSAHPLKRYQLYYGAQNDYMHMFIVWEFLLQLHRSRTSVTQDLLAGIILCNSGVSIRYFL